MLHDRIVHLHLQHQHQHQAFYKGALLTIPAI
jgi:hypothetical protein